MILYADESSKDAALEVVDKWLALYEKDDFLKKLAEVEAGHKRHVFRDIPIAAKGKTFIPKYYRHTTFSHKAKALIYHQVGRRNFSTLCHLMREGVRVTTPLALLTLYQRGLIHSEVLFTEKIPDNFINFKEFAPTISGMDEHTRRAFLFSLASELAALHDARAYTEDTDKNTFVLKEGLGYTFIFLDFDNVYPWRPPNFRRRAKNLSKFLNLFPDGDVHFMAKEYLKLIGKESWSENFVDEIFKRRGPLK
ncbi:MAG: hypothetical protein C0608_07855 [Deltaproteobacteria bacterium]|nr:MAG: hypothetical protein C0608_07855 [Deltaproteobacteria bacterium]